MIGLFNCLEIVLSRLENSCLVLVPENFRFWIGVDNAVKDHSLTLLLKDFAVQKLDLR